MMISSSSSAPGAALTTLRVAGTPGSLAQSTTPPFWSASMTMTEAPRSARTVARIVALVVFPTPPLGDVTAMIDMAWPFETGALQGRFRRDALMEAYGGSADCHSHRIALASASGPNDFRKTFG